MPHSIKFGRWAALIIALLLLAAGPGAAALAAIQASATYVVTATVAPLREVIVNQDGIITEIEGNTSQPLTPIACNTHNEPIALTAAILAQYNQIMVRPGLSHKVGVIYQEQETQPPALHRQLRGLDVHFIDIGLLPAHAVATLLKAGW